MKRRKNSSFIAEFAKRIGLRLKEHDILTYSASLSFYMLLSFIPLIFIAIAGVGEVAGRNKAVTEQVLVWIKDIFPFMTGRMEDSINGLVRNRGLFGGIGFFTLIWTAHMVLAEGEKVVRVLFGVEKSRWLLLSQIVAWGIFLLSVIFLTLSFLFGLYLRLAQSNLLPRYLSNILGPFIDGIVIKNIPAVMVALTVAAAYKFLPQRKVPVSIALIGGVSFAVLWEAAKRLFFIYAGKAHYLSLIYGSLGAFMMFLLFVYYSAILFIVIAEFVACTLDMKR